MCTAELEACWELRGTTGVAASCFHGDSVMQRVPMLLQDTHSWRTVVTSPLNCCQPVLVAYPSAQEDHLRVQWRDHISPVITADDKSHAGFCQSWRLHRWPPSRMLTFPKGRTAGALFFFFFCHLFTYNTAERRSQNTSVSKTLHALFSGNTAGSNLNC